MKHLINQFFVAVFMLVPLYSHAGDAVSAFELIYDEKEEGTDYYRVKYTVAEHFIRIDDHADSESEKHEGESAGESGYIIFDIDKRVIYSVSHYDGSILVIPEYANAALPDGLSATVYFEELDGAPTISGKQVFSYRVVADTPEGKETCMEIQLASGLKLDVAEKLRRYQAVVSAQQIRNLKTIPKEYRTACYLIDQVYNDGQYYDRGLPIHEWHSDNRIRMLKSFGDVTVDSKMFDLPKGYRRFKLEEVFD